MDFESLWANMKPRGVYRKEPMKVLRKVRIPQNPRKTHCLRGHERTPENLYGKSQCAICARARSHGNR